MIDLVLAYDDNDSELGQYFEEGSQDITNTISKLDFINLHPIDGLNCTMVNVTNKASTLNHNAFIFVGLCHGNRKELVANEAFVNLTNSEHFINSLFYTVACSSSYSLGKKVVVNDNGKCYIGYYESSWASYDNFNSIYIECENYALNEFLRTDKTIGEAFEDMLTVFNNKILEMYDQDEILVAIELEKI